MIKIKNVEVYGMQQALYRAGYPMQVGEPLTHKELGEGYGNLKLAKKLSSTPLGSGHSNFLKGIVVQFDLQYPQYYSKHIQRYNWFDIISSQSAMHKLTSRELGATDFNSSVWPETIKKLNERIVDFNVETDKAKKNELFHEIMSNLPSGYLLWMGITTNYMQLRTIYRQRKNHKLNEWKQFCKFIELLPNSELITN